MTQKRALADRSLRSSEPARTGETSPSQLTPAEGDPQVDILAFGAHPDDVEIAIGGSLAAFLAAGRTVGIVDLTAGELGTLGSAETRAAEAREAAARLGVGMRSCLALPDGHLHADDDSRRAVVGAIRTHRPSILITHAPEDLHPDHVAASRLVREAHFLAGLANYAPGQAPHRARTVLSYLMHTQREPDLVVDVGAHVETKRHAMRAYASQFEAPKGEAPRTFLSRPIYWEYWESRMRHYGQMIGATHGEPFLHAGPIPMTDPVEHFADFGYYPDPARRPAETAAVDPHRSPPSEGPLP